MAYSSKVLEHYENPRNVGKFEINETVGTGMVGAPACGDVMKLQIKVVDDVIIDARFKTYGCLTSNALINTPTKSKKISDLVIGDEVLAWNGTNIVNQKIRAVLKHSVTIDDLLVVTFQRETSRKNIKSKTFSLICTKEHIFWNADNTPVEAQQLVAGQELYEITEHELRILTNNRHRVDLKEKNSKRMTEWNTQFDHSVLPQNQPGYVCKDLPLKKQRSAEASRKNWENPVYVDKWRQGMANIDRSVPTSIEKKYINLFEKNNVAAKWCSGKVWIQSSTGPVSPDFVVPGKKKCIEVYTKNMPKFMQDRSDESDYVVNRKQQLASAGYDSLFLAVEEIDTSLKQVQNFIHNGMKIVSVSAVTHHNQLRGCERDDKKVVVYDLKLEDGAHVFFSERVGSHNCGSAIASSSLITEMVKGMTLDQAGAIKNSELAEELSLPPVKIHCSILAEDAIKAAVADYRSKHDNANA